MLNLAIFLPVITGLVVLALPSRRPALIRQVSLAGAFLTLAASVLLWIGFDPSGPALQSRTVLDWIPAIGASYDVAVDGVSLPLITLTALLTTLALVYVLNRHDRPKAHAFLFLLMETGLIGVFSSRDLLLFYLFFEIGLVPMYFIIGVWGHEQRRYAAVKFFLYTRAGSLAMLLSFLGLYLAMQPHTFSLDAIAAANPFRGNPAAWLVLLGLLTGFGVKLPVVPLHNWLPDAHVEAPTEGSVLLAGVLLKLGGYGLVRIMIPVLPDGVRDYAWILLVLALVSLVYGALAALAQSDLKRLVAYTSVNHMGFVLLGVAIWGLSTDTAIRQLALNGAVVQMISHGLLTGALFFMVGMLQDRADTREMDRFTGLLREMPMYSGILGLLAFGSLGLPGLSGFIAEFQVIGAAVGVSLWAAVVTLLGVIITTGLFIRILVQVVMGDPSGAPRMPDLEKRELAAVVPLAALSVLIGILPFFLLRIIESATRALAQTGLAP